MDYTFLKGDALEQLMAEDKFVTADEINIVHLLNFKHNRVLFVRIPSNLCEKNPHDGYCWSKTKTGKDRKVVSRHQPTYSKIQIYGETVTMLKCTDLANENIHKQVFTYQGFTYSYYFSTSLGDIQVNEVASKRLSKAAKEQLKNDLLPMRTVSNAVKLAREKGLSVTTKQVANLARSTSTCLKGRTGPRSKTSLKMAEELKGLYPNNVWFEKNDANLLTEFCYVRIYDNACRMYLEGCPTEEKWNEWTQFVETLRLSDEDTRRVELKQVLRDHPTGVFFPSRLHVDTTFDLGDLYVTFMLGESNNFKTKSSMKPRVFPIGYMLHSSKEAKHHSKFATLLKEKFDSFTRPNDRRMIPCVLCDGESSLEIYPQVLQSMVIRCDIHILSLLRFVYGGKAAALKAKPLLFGTMKNGKWKTGLFGCFDGDTFDRRLRRIKPEIDFQIYRWLKRNKQMLMDSCSAIAKLRGGHILQYSTNNQNETFNGILKASISRRNPAPDLIKKLDICCQDKLREMWLSAILGSELVIFSGVFDGDSLQDKVEAYSSSGLTASRVLALEVPLRIAEGFDLEKMYEEDVAYENLQLMKAADNMFHLTDTSLPTGDRGRFCQVSFHGGVLECWKCVVTLPAYLCSHVVFCLHQLSEDQVDFYWDRLLESQSGGKKPVNAFAAKSGSKKSDRIGSKHSARNYVRRIADISNLTYADDSSVTSPNDTLQSHGSSTPSTSLTTSPLQNGAQATSSSFAPSSVTSSAERRSSRSRRIASRYTPTRDYNTTDDGDYSMVF